MKKIIMITILSFFSAMGGEDLLPSAKRISHTALKNDGPLHAFDILLSAATSAYAPRNQESSSDQDIQTEDLDNEDTKSSSTRSSIKRLHSEIPVLEKHHWCDTCQKDLSTEDNFNRHMESLLHREMEKFRAQGIEAVIKKQGSIYKAMTIQEAQEYDEKMRQVEDALKDRTLWKIGNIKKNLYKCIPCGSSFQLSGVYDHMQTDKHRTATLEINKKNSDELICNTCNMRFPNKRRFNRHITEDIHKNMEKFRALGEAAVIVRKGTKSVAMTMKQAQEYNEKMRQVRDVLKNRAIWKFSPRENKYKCIPCNLYIALNRIYGHIKTQRHQGHLGAKTIE